uniref:DDHD domain-containing protein n=1 Tax=Syphacia muris TaxID=451379 RepID=A0A0N5AWW5_9BILA
MYAYIAASRICAPQLLMEFTDSDDKKSRLESYGEGSGVEIKKNEPYSSGPGGSGQYTYKIYHLGKRIPAWIRNIIPNETLQVHEEAWNAYPYTKTKYHCPAFNRITLEIETKYFNDAGRQSNVFNLSGEELDNRIVDVVDIVNDPVSSSDYCEEEDPKIYKSTKTGRGPLTKEWVSERINSGEPLMCAYKLCRVVFRFWGLQSRVEGWIHSYALRNTMLRAHIQAWVWQDEWYGLTMSDVRRLEQEAAEHLNKIMAKTDNADSESSSGVYYDCVDWEDEEEKHSLARWSSELLAPSTDSPPSTPRCIRSAALLVLFFCADISPEISSDYKPTDVTTLQATIEKQIGAYYPQLISRVRFLYISCGNELHSTASQLITMCPSFGIFNPVLALLLSSTQAFQEAVNSSISRANQAYLEFTQTEAGKNFQGEVFVVGDHLGGLLLYECLKKSRQHSAVSRHSSSLSAGSHQTRDDRDCEASWSVFEFPIHEHIEPLCCRNLSAPPLSPQRTSVGSENDLTSSLEFHASTAFFLGCPLALFLAQKKLFGSDFDKIDCGQIFNLYYALDPCSARMEPLLGPKFALLPPVNVPRFQRYPLGDGQQISFENVQDIPLIWGRKRIDHALHCPHAMVALPSTALPSILHASYWESEDVASFILRQFVRTEEIPYLSNLANLSTIPSEIEMPEMSWVRKRTKYKVKNLAPNHRGNDVILVEGSEQQFSARFCYGPVDLVKLSHEKVSAFVCPVGGDWHLISTEITDSHGRVTFSLNNKLPVGIHGIKMIVHGDHSFLDLFVAVVPKGVKIVIFSVDGSLTGSVSVTGRDPRVRPGAVDVVRFWHDLGYLITYVTARPDMQQRVVSSWLSLHNFPHGLLIFTPSFSREPLKQKMLHLKYLIEMGITVHAAYGSNKDISVYSCAGIRPDRILSVSSNKRRGCQHVDNYSTHLSDLNNGTIEFAQPADYMLVFHHNVSFSLNNQRNLVQRTHSFTPRSGRYDDIIKEKK